MIAKLLPAEAVAVEAFDDALAVELFPAEQELIRRAVDTRRREFSTARRCAREALAALGHPPAPLLPGERGAPAWPAGVVGSITHCAGYRAAVVARAADLWTVGVDAEPNEPLPDGVLSAVASEAEAQAVAELLARDGAVRWDRLLFSAKESVYKAWFPLAHTWLDFHEAAVEFTDGGAFSARLLVPGPSVAGTELTGFAGRWAVADGLILTAIAVRKAA
jgi:4'-phosphopantetheinyl transferase EntD